MATPIFSALKEVINARHQQKLFWNDDITFSNMDLVHEDESYCKDRSHFELRDLDRIQPLPVIEIFINSPDLKGNDDRLTATLLHEFGHYCSWCRGQRPVSVLLDKFNLSMDKLSLHDAYLILAEETRAWRIGLVSAREYGASISLEMARWTAKCMWSYVPPSFWRLW
jgi:hypothetical protein